MRVRVGVAEAAREIELDVEDADEFVKEVNATLASDVAVLWVSDIDGHRVGIPAAKIAYVEIEEGGQKIRPGFG